MGLDYEIERLWKKVHSIQKKALDLLEKYDDKELHYLLVESSGIMQELSLQCAELHAYKNPKKREDT
jgi:hypothetical protein